MYVKVRFCRTNRLEIMNYINFPIEAILQDQATKLTNIQVQGSQTFLILAVFSVFYLMLVPIDLIPN